MTRKLMALGAALAFLAAGCQDENAPQEQGGKQQITCEQTVTRTYTRQTQLIQHASHPREARAQVFGAIQREIEALFDGVTCPPACKHRVIEMEVRKFKVEFAPVLPGLTAPADPDDYLMDVDVDVTATLKCAVQPADAEAQGPVPPTPFPGDPTGAVVGRTPTPIPTGGVPVLIPGSTIPTPTPYPTPHGGACGECLRESDAGREDMICPWGEAQACADEAAARAKAERFAMIGQASSAGVLCNFSRCPHPHVAYTLLPVTATHARRAFTDPASGAVNHYWVYSAVAPYELRKFCLGPGQSLR